MCHCRLVPAFETGEQAEDSREVEEAAFKGLSTTTMVNLTAPLAARLSPTLGKKADDLMVASRYGR